MSYVLIYTDVENLVKQWVLTTPVAPLLTRTDGGTSIFLAMPASSPLPALVLSRVGGAPRASSDVPEDAARMTFNCWGTTRTQCGQIARTLMAELENLSQTGGFVSGDARLVAAQVLNMFWLPDPESDTARYIVDATVVTVSA